MERKVVLRYKFGTKNVFVERNRSVRECVEAETVNNTNITRNSTWFIRKSALGYVCYLIVDNDRTRTFLYSRTTALVKQTRTDPVFNFIPISVNEKRAFFNYFRLIVVFFFFFGFSGHWDHTISLCSAVILQRKSGSTFPTSCSAQSSRRSLWSYPNLTWPCSRRYPRHTRSRIIEKHVTIRARE